MRSLVPAIAIVLSLGSGCKTDSPAKEAAAPQQHQQARPDTQNEAVTSEASAPAPEAKAEPKPPSMWDTLDKSPETQSKRAEFIEKLKVNGIVHRIETPTDYPRIYVGDGWASLMVEDKSAFVSAVLTYYYATNPKADTAILRDSRTGKQIGAFTFEQGLTLE